MYNDLMALKMCIQMKRLILLRILSQIKFKLRKTEKFLAYCIFLSIRASNSSY